MLSHTVDVDTGYVEMRTAKYTASSVYRQRVGLES